MLINCEIIKKIPAFDSKEVWIHSGDDDEDPWYLQPNLQVIMNIFAIGWI